MSLHEIINNRQNLTCYALAWLLGNLSLQAMSALPDGRWLYALPLLLLLFYRVPALRLPSLFALSLLWALWHAQAYFTQVLPSALVGEELVVSVRIVDLPQLHGPALRFNARVESGVLASRQLRLSWYNHKKEHRVWPRAGEQWQLKVKLKPPHGNINPGGFDYEMWLYQQGIHATGYVREDAINKRLSAASGWSIDALRETISEAIRDDNRAYGGLLAALAVGDSSDIDDAHWDALLITGTNHLMSISGLHVSMIAAMLYWITLRLIPLPILRYTAAQPIAAAVGLIAAALYAALAGFAIPTQRSLIMLAVVLGAIILRRPLQPLNALAVALLAVLLLDPLAVLAPGFWFSFMAVAVIVYSSAGRMGVGIGNLWWRFGRIHTVITLALFPLSIFLFQQSSLVAPLANFFMVPWVSFVVVPLTLLGVLMLGVMPLLANWLFDLANNCLAWVWPVMNWLAQWPLAKWVQPAPSLGAMLLACCGVLLLLAPRGFPLRWAGVCLLLPALLIRPPVLAPGEFRATVLDVGQGLAVMIETRSHNLLFDTGPAYGDSNDAGERLIVPFLRHQAISRLDALVISNGDADHIGGAASILANVQVDWLTGQDLEKLQHDHKSACARDQRWTWDGVTFEFLHPDQPDTKRNNYSCVLKISNDSESLLIAADIEKKIEKRLLATSFEQLRSDVLVVPHHGSKTSSTENFITAVQPRYALVSAGYLNRFGHPIAEVVQRYQQAQVTLLNTAETGSIALLFDGKPGLQPILRRQISRHYWSHQSSPTAQ